MLSGWMKILGTFTMLQTFQLAYSTFNLVGSNRAVRSRIYPRILERPDARSGQPDEVDILLLTHKIEHIMC